MLEYSRPVPPEWRARLAEITPPGGRISWLELVWESGNPRRRNPAYKPEDLLSSEQPWLPAEPVNRWVLYEVTPAAGVPFWKEISLLETPVGSPGHQRILNYYRDSGGCLMEPFWVIQGSNGGHKYQFNETEQNLLILAGLPWEAPPPGTLPYAPFDERVVRQVMKWDHLRRGYAELRTARRLGRKADQQAFREQLVRFLTDQVQDSIDQLTPVIDDNTMRLSDTPEPDYDEIDRRYVEAGVLT